MMQWNYRGNGCGGGSGGGSGGGGNSLQNKEKNAEKNPKRATRTGRIWLDPFVKFNLVGKQPLSDIGWKIYRRKTFER